MEFLHSLRLCNFRNFENNTFHFHPGKNIIVGENGKGKTNILEAIALPVNFLSQSDPQYMTKIEKNEHAIVYDFHNTQSQYIYSKTSRKKAYILEKKNVSKSKFQENYPHIISFHPQMMQLLQDSPSQRRDFLDDILLQCFSDYRKIFLKYKKVLQSRNTILKRIFEGKSEPGELTYWDENFLILTQEIYCYRKKILDFFQEESPELGKHFFGKIQKLQFIYHTKTDINNVYKSLQEYIKNNQNKEILQRKTLRGPHLDDFQLFADDIPLESFASRGEMKSVLLGLKYIAGKFIEKYGSKTGIIFLIDDIISELDMQHIQSIDDFIGENQCIITSIYPPKISGNMIYI